MAKAVIWNITGASAKKHKSGVCIKGTIRDEVGSLIGVEVRTEACSRALRGEVSDVADSAI